MVNNFFPGSGDWLEREVYFAGECIFHAGDEGDAVYLVEQGEVEILMGASEHAPRLRLLGVGELFGEIAALDRLPRSHTVRATQPTTVIRVDVPHLKQLLDHSDAVVQYMFYALMGRLRRLSDYSGQLMAVNSIHAPLDNSLYHRMVNSLQVIADLRHTLDVGDLELRYTPVITLVDGTLAGFEASLHWQPVCRGRLTPENFARIAEHSGLIQELGTWMLHQAAQDWPQLRACCTGTGDSVPFLSLNFATPELSGFKLAEILQWCLECCGVPANEMRVQLGGNLLPTRCYDPEPGFSSDDPLTQVKNLGLNLALQEMSGGSAGIRPLQTLPFTSIRLDAGLVRQILYQPKSRKIAVAMLALAEAAELHATAEGVREIDTHHFLSEQGCRYGLGPLYAPAMPLAHALDWATHSLPLTFSEVGV